MKLKNFTRFNPYSPGFSIYLNFYEIKKQSKAMLQSLFTWIFYLFRTNLTDLVSTNIASILIHLDFLSISNVESIHKIFMYRFNPYSPGFSIYLQVSKLVKMFVKELQSLFTWIFYLFKEIVEV